jgi:16S rRNA (uracil1498-N3)-methyltransferase
MRLRAGDAIELFDGTGWSCAAAVERTSRRDVETVLTGPPAFQARNPSNVILAVAAPKQDRMRWLVEKGTELGVARVMPIVTQRSTVAPGAGALRKFEDAVIQACKQCGRNDLMAIDPPRSWEDLLDVVRAVDSSEVVIGDPRGAPLRQLALERFRSGHPNWLAIIGPEGGLTADEIQQATDAGAQPASWGPYILRIETAAIAAAAILCGLMPERRQ